MDDGVFYSSSPDQRSSPVKRKLCQQFFVLFRISVACREIKDPVLRTVNARPLGVTESRCRFDERVEDRLQIECRAADDFEHVSGRGLLLERFPQLVQQPGVLDRDNRLVREALDQLDLLVGEWAHLLAVYGYRPGELMLLKQWDREHSPISAELDGLDGKWISVNVILQRRDVGILGHL